MKNLKNISLKAAALCMAVLTTASMVLNPYLLNAFDASIYFDRGITHESNYVNEWDMEEAGDNGGNTNCGFGIKNYNCREVSSSGKGGSGSGSVNIGGGSGSASGSGMFNNRAFYDVITATACIGGTSLVCTFSDPCNGIALTHAIGPKCSVITTVVKN